MQGYPTPRCVCVNAVDKGVSERFGVKAVDKELMAPGDCGNRFGGGEKEGLDGDTVQQNLALGFAASVRGVQVALATKLRGVEYGVGYAGTTGRMDG
jgi:hypothetical protein